MPANKKYLIQSNWTKASKIVAIIVGGMVTSVSLHLALAYWIGFNYVIPTSLFSIFMIWGFFMIMVYWIKKPWKSWSILLLITIISIVGIYISKK